MTNGGEGIIDCGGKYEVHPATDDCKDWTDLSSLRWTVVDGETGSVYAEHEKREGAISHAAELNDAPETCNICSGTGIDPGSNRPDDWGPHRNCEVCHGTGESR